jgi:hypothetical protein
MVIKGDVKKVSKTSAKKAQMTQIDTKERDVLSQYIALYYTYFQGVAKTHLVGL